MKTPFWSAAPTFEFSNVTIPANNQKELLRGLSRLYKDGWKTPEEAFTQLGIPYMVHQGNLSPLGSWTQERRDARATMDEKNGVEPLFREGKALEAITLILRLAGEKAEVTYDEKNGNPYRITHELAVGGLFNTEFE